MKAFVVPSPADTPAEVVVSGSTSTLKRIRIVRTGTRIPETFSRDLMTNTEGYAWYVSRHYALKTDYSDARARELLTLLELAFPHYVALFGRQIPDLDRRRMACVFGSSMERLQVAMRDDAMFVFGGGGITQEGFWACYQVPSNEYHNRYIIIHECVHLYQYCLEGTTTNTCLSFLEGVADRLASHVYDPQRKRLTVNVLDRAPVHNFLEYGRNHLRKHRGLGFVDFVQGGDRGFNVLVTTFMQRDPESLQKWRLYRDEMFRTSHPATKQAVAERLVRSLYGRPEKVWADFRAWVGTVRPTFFMADWGFDQYGDTLVSFGTPRDRKRFSQMNVNLVPGRRPQAGRFHMDYPAGLRPSIVGPIRRGGAEPSIGCVVDFSRANGKGMAGLGLAREGLKHFRVLVDREERLVVDGTDLRAPKRAWALPAALRAAMHDDGHRVGLTVRIGSDRLAVTVRAGSGTPHEFRASLRLGPGLRRRLVSKPLAVLGIGARHLITPLVDDGRPVAPDLALPASADPWRNAADDALFAVYRACWRLGRKTPPLLRALRRQLLVAAEQDLTAQKAAAAGFREQLPALVAAVRGCGVEPALKERVLVELSGASLALVLRDGRAADSALASVRLNGPVAGDVTGSVRISPGLAAAQAVAIRAGAACEVSARLRRSQPREPFAVTATARLRWLGASFTLRAHRVGDSAFPCGWTIGPFATEGKLEDKPHEIETSRIDLSRVYFGQTGTLVPWRRFERGPATPVDLENLLYFNRQYAQQANHAFAYVLAWVHSAREQEAVLALGAADGVVAWVNGEKVFTNLRQRDWSPREDRAPIVLKKGVNKVLLKSVHGSGLWFFSAHLENAAGHPPVGVHFLRQAPQDECAAGR